MPRRRWLLCLALPALLTACARPAPPTPAPPSPPKAGGVLQIPAPTPAAGAARDLWQLSVADLLAGGNGAGRHHTLHGEGGALKLSPDGRRALVWVEDQSRTRVTHPGFIDVWNLETDERQRLPLGSEWWAYYGWLPDGRILLVGAHLWVSDAAGRQLSDRGDTGGATVGSQGPAGLVAWSFPYRTADGPAMGSHSLAVLDLTTDERRIFPGPFGSGGPHSVLAPMFSPDGRYLALNTWADNTRHVSRLAVADGKVDLLDVGPSQPAFWSGDSLYIWRQSEPWALVRLAPGGQRTVVYQGDDLGYNVSPDGRWLLLSRMHWPRGGRGYSELGLLDLRKGEATWTGLRDVSGTWTAGGDLLLLQDARS